MDENQSSLQEEQIVPGNLISPVEPVISQSLQNIPESSTSELNLGLVEIEHGSASDDDLSGIIVNSEEEAYNLYNDYAFRIGFSVRRGKQRYRVDGTISMKIYFCYKAGEKDKTVKIDKCYSKLDVRTSCGAFVQFDVDRDGAWIVTKHQREHNHDLCPSSSSNLLRSHRRVSKTQLSYLKELKKSGVGVADGVRLLKNQSGGSPFLGFLMKDAYNALGNSNVLDGTDSNTLIQIFKKRQANENNFFFYFEVDSESRLCSFFWRDGRMRQDYERFGDFLVHDTTYRTNKYDMICAPFVGMNHHCKNVMFGCGFLLNERIESFEWLFGVFLRSMGGKHPQAIRTDQCPAISAAISKVFPMSRHRYCIRHIGENSKKNIKSLRSQKGFLDLFNHVLKYTDTEAELQFYWDKMVNEYKCHNNSWLERLYGLKEKWCPAFNKNWFSGGILSSQKSETTNHSVSKRVFKTASLCDFFNTFVEVVSEWRSKENGEDTRCLQGQPPMAMNDVKLLLHAREVYTIEVYYLFEEQYLKGASCHQSLVCVDGTNMKYHVWREGPDIIRHEVHFNTRDLSMFCTCKLLLEVGILCCHCLRIMNIQCVSMIPEMYILKRWRKDVNLRSFDDMSCRISSSTNSMADSLWRIQMMRKFHTLILASEGNNEARLKCEEAFERAKSSIIAEVGPIYFEDCGDSLANDVIQNPQSSSAKGRRNKRMKSISEKKYNQARGHRKKAQSVELQTKTAVQSSVQESISRLARDGYVVHPSSGSSNLVAIGQTMNSQSISFKDSLSSNSLDT